jgi:heme/copper-type cytochrome/quinol oxidase subunit 3
MPTDGSSEEFDDDGNGPRQASFGNVQTVGMVLFLMALAVLFVSGLFGFIWIRLGVKTEIKLPKELWLSTILVIGVSIALARAGALLRQGKQRSFRNALTASLALALGFLTVQAPALWELLSEHQQFRAGGMHLYGFIFFLVLLHALHVVGGMFALIIVAAKAHQGAYDQAGPGAIRSATLYWHFLDGVWVVMFAVLLLMR